jgi:hypothetical protein
MQRIIDSCKFPSNTLSVMLLFYPGVFIILRIIMVQGDFVVYQAVALIMSHLHVSLFY